MSKWQVRETPPPTFEVTGDLSDEAIEALAGLLLAIVGQDNAEVAGRDEEE